jgi:VWFA-related protein
MLSPRFVALCLLLLSLSAWSQSHGGGSHASGGTTTAVRPDATGTPTTTSGDSIYNASDEGKIEFRTQSILVQVPVVVADKSGDHVHGLMKSDLHVFENGKEQTISHLDEVTASTTKLVTPAAQPGVFRNLNISADQPRNVTVFVLDTINTPFLDQARGREELVRYLASNLAAGQVQALMIMTGSGVRIVQGLTGDPDQLLNALKKVSGQTPAMQGVDTDIQASIARGQTPEVSTSVPDSADPTVIMEMFIAHGDAIAAQFQQANAIENTLNGFRAIAWALSGIPGRKSLIWATGGFPFEMQSPNSVPGGYLSPLYERTMQALSQAQISVYPVDVRGLVNNNILLDASRHDAPAAFKQGSGTRIPTTQQMTNRTWLQEYTTDILDEFAEMTGGRAFYNTNDLATSFKRASDDASSYYLVSYYMDLHNNRAGWRQIKVKVDKPDTEVRARKGFFVTNATIHMDVTRRSDLVYAMNSPIEGTGVPMDVKWLGITGAGAKKKAAFAVNVPAGGISQDPSGQNKINFDIAVAAFAVNGKEDKPVNSMGKTFATSVTNDQLATIKAKGVGFNYDLDLAPGKYSVRFVVRDNVSGKIGSVTAPLTVN